jgi:hypothetical protein
MAATLPGLSLASMAAGHQNSMASLRPSEAFPDLHHKMSKKIAQLTKVIYHLNSKNEDHQVRSLTSSV